jgi:hypothetical protein
LEEDGDVELDLASVFHTAYDGGYYDRRLPYAEPLDPPPGPETEEWIRDRLAERL